ARGSASSPCAPCGYRDGANACPGFVEWCLACFVTRSLSVQMWGYRLRSWFPPAQPKVVSVSFWLCPPTRLRRSGGTASCNALVKNANGGGGEKLRGQATRPE